MQEMLPDNVLLPAETELPCRTSTPQPPAAGLSSAPIKTRPSLASTPKAPKKPPLTWALRIDCTPSGLRQTCTEVCHASNELRIGNTAGSRRQPEIALAPEGNLSLL